MASIPPEKELPYYVYVWAYPDGDVFYVGVGEGPRWTEMHGRNQIVRAIVSTIEANGQHVQKIIIARFRARQHAAVYEAMMIESYGLQHLGNRKSGCSNRILGPLYIKPKIRKQAYTYYRKEVDKIMAARMTRQEWQDEGLAM